MTSLPAYLFAPDRPAWRNPFYEKLTWERSGRKIPVECFKIESEPIGRMVREFKLGYGTNAETVSEGAARALAEYQIKQATKAAMEYPWFKVLDNNRPAYTPRSAVMVILIWRMGAEAFVDLVRDCSGPHYFHFKMAANNIEACEWTDDERWLRELAEMMRNGEWP